MRKDGKKSTINEIIIKYKRTNYKTIYVEGLTDKSLIKWFLKKSEIKDIIVLEIQTVNIEKEKILELNLNLDENNRSRVITLSFFIKKGIIGVIDSDFDFLEKPNYEKPLHLLSTDYSAMENYCFNEEILEKILIGYPTKQPINYQIFLDMIGNILVELFLIRFTKENKDKERSYTDFNKNLSLNSQEIKFDRDKYLVKYLNNQTKLIQEFKAFIQEQKNNLSHNTDIRQIIHGHDFVTLLQFYLEIKQKDAKETFEKSLYGYLEYKILKEENMFKKLLQLT